MKITSTNYLTYTKTKDASRLRSAAKGDDQRITKKFDEISISHTHDRSDTAFAETIANRLKAEVRNTSSSQKLEDIRSQIEDKNYAIDFDEIVKKMMLSV